MLDTLRTGVMFGLVTLVVAIAGYAIVQDRHLDRITQERDTAITQRHAAERALIVLADQHAEEIAQKTTATAAREGIRALDVSNEPPVGESLRRALEAADMIGGVK